MAPEGAALSREVVRAPAAPHACVCFDPLSERAPDLSARVVLPSPQRRTLRAVAAIFIGAFALAPIVAAVLCAWCGAAIFAGMIVLRYAAAFAPRKCSNANDGSDILPLYSILCPVYREAASLPGLVAALDLLDYPRARLDVIILIEPDDGPTRAAAEGAAESRPWLRVLVAPEAGPRTKPKALNAGLAIARGELLTVYDAEDRPHPSQLRAAAAAFAADDGRLGCVQAPLNAYNGAESWIAGQFALEYRIQFGCMLPFVARLGWPILLGGTSNHFRTEILRTHLGWDSYNVTEDADLGLRLARAGLRTEIIAPPTFEEAPIRVRAWRRQRTRWIKGHLVTWLVHMRRPSALWRDLGPWRFLGAQLTLGGGLLSSALHGPLIAWALIGACASHDWRPLLTACAIGYGAAFACAVRAAIEDRAPRILLRALSAPFYWPMQTFAALAAFSELVRAPHVWAKTEHGLTAAPSPIIGAQASLR